MTHVSPVQQSMGELIQFMGMRLKIATTFGFERRKFWSVDIVGSKRKTPFKFNNLTSKHRFDDILRNLHFTKKAPPAYRDRFYDHKEMEEEWNRNISREYAPSDRTSLDESMKKWVEKFTCPGFLVVQRNQWPFGNEYMPICDCNPYEKCKFRSMSSKRCFDIRLLNLNGVFLFDPSISTDQKSRRSNPTLVAIFRRIPINRISSPILTFSTNFMLRLNNTPFSARI